MGENTKGRKKKAQSKGSWNNGKYPSFLYNRVIFYFSIASAHNQSFFAGKISSYDTDNDLDSNCRISADDTPDK